jgi:hypothetical protein
MRLCISTHLCHGMRHMIMLLAGRQLARSDVNGGSCVRGRLSTNFKRLPVLYLTRYMRDVQHLDYAKANADFAGARSTPD